MSPKQLTQKCTIKSCVVLLAVFVFLVLLILVGSRVVQSTLKRNDLYFIIIWSATTTDDNNDNNNQQLVYCLWRLSCVSHALVLLQHEQCNGNDTTVKVKLT